MPSHRASAATAGALYLVTFATSFPALALKLPFLEGGGSAVAAQSAAVLEILLALACIGTAVAMHPIGRRFSPTLAPGFVASRLLEASVIVTGVLALLSLTTTRAAPDPSPAVDTALVAVHDWAFLIGPGFMAPVNALILGTLLFRHRLVPRVIPLLGLVGAPVLAASSLGQLFGVVDPLSPIAAVAALPVALWELSVGVWLVARGVRAGDPRGGADGA